MGELQALERKPQDSDQLSRSQKWTKGVPVSLAICRYLDIKKQIRMLLFLVDS